MGSVKDLTVLESPAEDRAGTGIFRFSDRYSVFDWGEMPDEIRGKGAALCILSAYFFEKLEAMDVRTHYLGVLKDGRPARLDDLTRPADCIQVKLVRVIRPELKEGWFDYSIFNRLAGNYLIPLEVIYRNALPSGASVFKRLESGRLSLQDIGLDRMPVAGQNLDRTILDVSTKLEKIDRYILWDEAQNISGLSAPELETLKKQTLQINELITSETERVGLFNEDGKVEFALDEKRQLMLVDVLGTPDECRFTREGLPVSKEVARIFYRGSSWHKEVEAAKKKDATRWKEMVGSKPQPLPPPFLESLSHLYQACCNEITRREWFRTPPLKTILADIHQFLPGTHISA